VAGGNPSWLAMLTAVAVAVLTAALMVATGAARALAAATRRAAGRLLGEHLPPPPPRHARLGDGPGWRAMAYLMLKLPAGLAECYAVGIFWVAGLVDLTYPFWWLSFRNHSPGVRLNPVPVITPFDWSGTGGHFRVTTFPGTFAAFGAGVGMLLAAPWVTRAVVAADRWLVRGLLGPGRTALRLQDLEQTRALAVDDAAARLRRLERDLHDGAQIRLATLAMNLGMARKKLGDEGTVPDLAAARELVGAAHGNAKDALVELRELARGIHPPVLDNGLADALASLAATSAIPAELAVSVPVRPTPAIETIAYFCAAELLANAAKHSHATTIKIFITERAGLLALQITDDGLGGADPSRGSGLSGLAQRVAVVDGRLDIASPPGGPTKVTVELPLHAGHR
jgi:signal transduction histidine kinase